MGTPEITKQLQDAGFAYCDSAGKALEAALGHGPTLEELATFYGAAIGGMQGAVIALIHEMSPEDTEMWLGQVAQITQAVLEGKRSPLVVSQALSTVPQKAAPVPAQTNGQNPPAPPPAAAVAAAPSGAPPETSPVCACLNKTGMCGVCLESLVARLKRASAWILQVQEFKGVLNADCPACTPRILDRAVAQTMKKTIDGLGMENRHAVLSALLSALPQLTGEEAWPETVHMATQLCPALAGATGE